MDQQRSLSWWQPVLLSAMAGAMGWGIRGQYGHESGAMIAGLLVSLTLVFLFCPAAVSLPAARAVACVTVAIGFGGSMTYGQTIGLTQDAPLIGHWDAWRWGMLGLAIKGGIWIGFAGVFLGMGLSEIRYRPIELLLSMLALVGLYYAGLHLFNEPFDPARKILPRIYFSDDWRWEPGAMLKPRREDWGGLLLGLAALVAFTGVWKRDRLALNLAGWGILGGALGFPLGQCVQSFHAWNPDLFQLGFWVHLEPHMNWWNMMETTFGGIMGAALGLGVWLNRYRLSPLDQPAPVTMPAPLEWLLVLAHGALLISGEFFPVPRLAEWTDLGLAMGIIPILGIATGRWWPYLLALPITALPIAGKTIRELSYRQHVAPEWLGWLVYGVLPVLAALAAAWWFGRSRESMAPNRGANYLRAALIISTAIYFGLNFAFFRYPWPWSSWTVRTPNAIIFGICALGLIIAAFTIHRSSGDESLRGREETEESAAPSAGRS